MGPTLPRFSVGWRPEGELRVADRSKYLSSFDIHKRILWLRFRRKPSDENEEREANVKLLGLGVYGIPLASPTPPPPFCLGRFREDSESSSSLSTTPSNHHLFKDVSPPAEFTLLSLGCHCIRNRFSLESLRAGRDHDEFIPAARALDCQLYF